jgi:predicted RecB family nuclease
MSSASYPITDIAGVDDGIASALKKAGIRTTARLLDAAKDLKGRQQLAAKTGISEKDILCWANMADRMRIKGVGEDYAALLQAAGVDTVRELKYRNPTRLAKAMAAANEKRKLVRVLPSCDAVVRWIECAKTLPPKISY